MSDSINPNISVGDESTSESKVGEVTSFEQLDRITDQQIKDASDEKAEARSQKVQATEAPEADEETEVNHEVSDAEINPRLGIDLEAIKPIQLSHGENKYDILPTAEVPIKVDGESQSVPLQELINNYSGKVAWDKRFNEINQEKQAFSKERREFVDEKEFVENKINRFHELSQTDPIQAFDFLCEIAGKDPIEFQKTFRDNLVKQFENYYELDDIGKREFNLTEQERLLDRRRQSETNKKTQAEQAQAQQREIQSAIEKYGIDEDRYHEVISELRRASPQTAIETSHVIRYERALLAQKIVRDVRPEKADDTQVLGELAAVMVQNPEFKEADLRGILAEIWKDEPSKTSKDLSKKVLKTQIQAKSGRNNFGNKVASGGQPWSFDQV